MDESGGSAAGERYSPGDVIAAKYRLIRQIDEGGMGTVWAAHNTDLDVHVAVKLIRAELAATAAAERLLNEARTLARLDHPAIIRVHDCGRTELGDPYIVMELLHGECLADTLEREGTIAPVRAVELLLPIVDAIRVTHDAGVVHRDIKPDNIYLARVGGRVQPKVLDFGIAISEFGVGRYTTHGTVLGSPAYMSPEQARGQSDVDAATDVWALSVVLYELIAGRPPFDGDNYNAVLRAIIEEEPPALSDRVDELLSSVMERGLAKDRQARWPSVQAFGVALAQWLWSQGRTEDAARISLRGTWLSREAMESEPPLSLNPVTVPGSEPPVRRSAPTLPRVQASAPVIREREERSSTHQSTRGLAVTAPHEMPRRRLWRWAAAGLVLSGGVVAGWLARPVPPRATMQSASSGHETPPPTPEPRKPPAQKEAAPAPKPDREPEAEASAEGDAGVKDETRAKPPPAPVHHAPRPATKNKPFRPSAI